MPNFEIHLDRLSFWLGFLAATLFWWLFSRIKPLVPLWRQQLRRQLELFSSRNFAGVDHYLRQQTILRAQSQHLAASLFSLDEVLIIPRLLVPPSGQDPEKIDAAQSIANSIIPYLPDWPELVASFGVASITLADALQSKRHIVLIGQPGSGKTVALAHLATQISRHDLLVKDFANAPLLYIHVVDLDTTLAEDQDPVQALIKCITSSANIVMQPQITRYLQSVVRSKSRPIVMILDGLDELPEHDLRMAVAYLETLIHKLPQLQVITTATAEFVDGLTHAGFYPLALAAWTNLERKTYASKWGELWTNKILLEIEKSNGPQWIDPKLMAYWLEDEPSRTTPLTLTLRLWGAYAGDLSGANTQDCLKSHVTRYLPDTAVLPAVNQLAHTMIKNGTVSISFDEMEKFLSSTKVWSGPTKASSAIDASHLLDQTGSFGTDAQVEDASNRSGTLHGLMKLKPNFQKSGRMEKITSPAAQVIEALLDAGILSQHVNDRLRFSNPLLMGFLASPEVDNNEAQSIISSNEWNSAWSPQLQMLRYTAACLDDAPWIQTLISEQNSPLYQNLLIAARWLADLPAKCNWRNTLMRTAYNLIQSQSLPLSMQARFIGAFYLSGDPSAEKLFQQLLSSSSPVSRRIGLIGCGASGNPRSIDRVLASLADKDREVRYTACQALAAIPGESTLKALVEILLSGDEEIRQAAAEALAQNPEEGYQVLREATTHEDLLTRRAAVFGLMQVHEAWAIKALEKVAVEDGQWVVRNAAAQAILMLQNHSSQVPARMKDPSETGWLITFASKLGTGIQPGEAATDVLLTVLKNGTIQEQIAALYFLRDHADDSIIQEIYALLSHQDDTLRESALHALWWIAISGTRLPAINS